MTNNPSPPRSPSFALFAPATVTGVKSFKRQLTQILFFSRLNAHTKKTASEKTLRFQITSLKPFNIRTEHRKTQEGRVEVRGPRLPPCRVYRGSKCVWNSWEAEQDGIDRQGATERQMNLRPPRSPLLGGRSAYHTHQTNHRGLVGSAPVSVKGTCGSPI